MVDKEPRYFQQLSSQDKEAYKYLQSQFSSKLCRNNRNQRVEKFNEILHLVKHFCIQPQNPENDNIRCLVCGLYWLPQGSLAINIRQLHILIDKCKSSINGSLQRIGYRMITNQSEALKSLAHFLPQINNYQEIREWSVREFGVQTPQPELSPTEIFQTPITSKASLTPNPLPISTLTPSFTNFPSSPTLSFDLPPPTNEVNELNELPEDNFNTFDPFACPPSFLYENQDDSLFYNI